MSNNDANSNKRNVSNLNNKSWSKQEPIAICFVGDDYENPKEFALTDLIGTDIKNIDINNNKIVISTIDPERLINDKERR
jgi:hypothetical protein